MEFERAVFRVYERSVESLVHDEPSPANARGSDGPLNKSCRLFEMMLLFSAFSFFVFLVTLHRSFVGNPGCLPQALMYFNQSSNASYPYQIQKDEILGINIHGDDYRWWSNNGNHDDDLVNHWDESSKINDGLAPSIRSSFLQLFESSSKTFLTWCNAGNYRAASTLQDRFGKWHEKARKAAAWKKKNMKSLSSRRLLSSSSSEEATNSSSSSSTATNTDHLLDFDYLIVFDEALFLMDNDVILAHSFRIINVTLPAHQCFGGSMTESLVKALNLFDLVVVNSAMFTTKAPGYMASRTGAIYHWTKQHLQQPYPLSLSSSSSFGAWLGSKIAIVINSLLSFFLLSTTTTLLVRVLITSGVILVFPTLWILRCCCGVNGFNLRMVAFSYPWIGYPLQAIRAAGQSPYPFLLAHFSRIVVYYLLYVAAQAIYVSWLYDDVTFGADQLWLYVIMMLWEYYTMIYVRAAMSITFFPRISFALYMLYHVYYYSYPSGFHLMALSVLAFLVVATMVHCIRVYETKAYRQGLVNHEQPRMLYAQMPWPTWRYDIAPDYSMFMPLNYRTQTVYQNTIPMPPGGGDVGGGGGANGTVGNSPPPLPPVPQRPATPGTFLPIPTVTTTTAMATATRSLGSDPVAGPFAALSGSIELSSIFRRRPGRDGSTNANGSASSSSSGSNGNVVNRLFSQVFTPVPVANYQSLATTSTHDEPIHHQQSSSSSNTNANAIANATTPVVISALHHNAAAAAAATAPNATTQSSPSLPSGNVNNV